MTPSLPTNLEKNDVMLEGTLQQQNNRFSVFLSLASPSDDGTIIEFD